MKGATRSPGDERQGDKYLPFPEEKMRVPEPYYDSGECM